MHLASSTDCSCRHYMETTKKWHLQSTLHMPPCPPDFEKHCCGDNCFPTYSAPFASLSLISIDLEADLETETEREREKQEDEEKPSEAKRKQLRSSVSGSDFNPSCDGVPFSQMIEECRSCGIVTGVVWLSKDSLLCKDCVIAVNLKRDVNNLYGTLKMDRID
jgi:hypothetical protein